MYCGRGRNGGRDVEGGREGGREGEKNGERITDREDEGPVGCRWTGRDTRRREEWRKNLRKA